jgi:hypothetical protein
MNDIIPIAIITLPITMAVPPKNESGMPERSTLGSVKFPFWKADGGSEGRIVPAATRVIRPRSIIIPPIMLRIAIIDTPVGRDLGVACKLL